MNTPTRMAPICHWTLTSSSPNATPSSSFWEEAKRVLGPLAERAAKWSETAEEFMVLVRVGDLYAAERLSTKLLSRLNEDKPNG
jgi:hypothetical protein